MKHIPTYHDTGQKSVGLGGRAIYYAFGFLLYAIYLVLAPKCGGLLYLCKRPV